MDGRKIWFLTLTQVCNLRCKYCGSDEVYDTEIEDLNPWPMEINYDLKYLKRISEDSDPIICFYGGEPTVRPQIIYQVMDMMPHAEFVLQTNGTLLHTLKPEYVNKMGTILISVDGNAEVTNNKRGKGTYEKAIENVKLIKLNGYKGDLIARMTISKGSDILRDVSYLINTKLFDHIHWQLDVCWDAPAYVSWDFKFLEWRDTNYLPGLHQLIDNWIDEMKNNGKVQGIAPLTAMVYSILTGEKMTRVRCGSGFSSFNVATNGDVTGCPIAPDQDIYGKIQNDDFNEKDMKDKAHLLSPCNKEECNVFELCGGRCMYANESKWWGDDGFKEVCVTVKEYIKMLQDRIPEIQQLIDSGKLTVEDFHYPSFNNSIEVIP
uniref:Radical SAM domain protein n=1 Tax=Entamoeba histolytica TaxID=5759 RepID=S0AVH6_ENTHI|nr:radical SAM domain protein [Entamoeba histolytica]